MWDKHSQHHGLLRKTCPLHLAVVQHAHGNSTESIPILNGIAVVLLVVAASVLLLATVLARRKRKTAEDEGDDQYDENFSHRHHQA